MTRKKAESFALVISIHLRPRDPYSECVRAAGEGRADFLDGFSNVISTTPWSLIVPPRHTSAGMGLRGVMSPGLISHCMIGPCTCNEPLAVTCCISICLFWLVFFYCYDIHSPGYSFADSCEKWHFYCSPVIKPP